MSGNDFVVWRIRRPVMSLNSDEFIAIVVSVVSFCTLTNLVTWTCVSRELCKDLFKNWSNKDESDFSIETVSGGITNLRGYLFLYQFIFFFSFNFYLYAFIKSFSRANLYLGILYFA